MNQSEVLTIISNLLKARETSRAQGAIGFGFAPQWLKNWREIFHSITKRSNSCYRSCAHGQSLLCLQLRADEAYGSVQWKMTL